MTLDLEVLSLQDLPADVSLEDPDTVSAPARPIKVRGVDR